MLLKVIEFQWYFSQRMSSSHLVYLIHSLKELLGEQSRVVMKNPGTQIQNLPRSKAIATQTCYSFLKSENRCVVLAIYLNVSPLDNTQCFPWPVHSNFPFSSSCRPEYDIFWTILAFMSTQTTYCDTLNCPVPLTTKGEGHPNSIITRAYRDLRQAGDWWDSTR